MILIPLHEIKPTGGYKEIQGGQLPHIKTAGVQLKTQLCIVALNRITSGDGPAGTEEPAENKQLRTFIVSHLLKSYYNRSDAQSHLWASGYKDFVSSCGLRIKILSETFA